MFFPSNYNEVIFMLLCTDVGNTNIKFALYKGEKLLMKLRFSTNRIKMPQKTPKAVNRLLVLFLAAIP